MSQPTLDYQGQPYSFPPLISITPSPTPAQIAPAAPTKYTDPGLNLYTNQTITAAPQAPAPVTTPVVSQAAPSALGGAPMSLVPGFNAYAGGRVMPTPSAYQVGLYRHMIWKILQADDPVLMEQLQTRLSPQGLFNALTYLRENQLDALSGPQNDPLFNSDPARLGVVVDDIAVWLAELDARQRAKIAAAAAKAKTGASVLPVMADSTQILLGLLLVAGGFGAMWYIRRNKEQRNF